MSTQPSPPLRCLAFQGSHRGSRQKKLLPEDQGSHIVTVCDPPQRLGNSRHFSCPLFDPLQQQKQVTGVFLEVLQMAGTPACVAVL